MDASSFCEVKMIKRKSLSVKEKAKIIWKLESGISNASLCKEFSISHSTISTIWKNREKIKKTFENDAFNVKKIRNSLHQDIDECLLQWFKSQRDLNIPINGPILQGKAQEFAKLLGKHFQPDASWVQRFRKRHGIVLSKNSNKSKCETAEELDDWDNVKEIRAIQHHNIEKCLLQWLISQQNLNIPINYRILSEKTQEFAKLLNKNFQPDSLFVKRFCDHYQIKCEDSLDIDSEIILKIKKDKIKSSRKIDDGIKSTFMEKESSNENNKPIRENSCLDQLAFEEAFSALSLLRSFFLLHGSSNQDTKEALCVLENAIEKNYFTKLHTINLKNKRKRTIGRNFKDFS